MNLEAQFPLLIPAVALVLTLLLREERQWAGVSVAAAFALWAVSVWAFGGYGRHAWDALALWYILLVCVLSGFCLLASAAYIGKEVAEGIIAPRRARRYYLLFYGAIASLLLIGTASNYVVVWAGVEGATLTTVVLVAFPRTQRAVEAAWKYVVVTGIGGLLALLGTVLMLGGSGLPMAAWGFGPAHVTASPTAILAVKVGFWLALIGYGSKSGFAPFHTWLPDAHSEAPAPVSALLSGIKLVGGVYALLRLLALASQVLGSLWPHRLLVGAGVLSLALAAGALAGQRDLKRLFAYSSVEHMGLIALGAGFGGIGLAGALLHMWTHGLAKTNLFFGSGNVRLRYGSTEGDRVRGVLAALPLSGAALTLGGLAIAGLPPFGLFWSEWLVLLAVIRQGGFVVVAVVLALLLAAFLGIALRMPRFLLGSAPPDIADHAPGEARLATWGLFVELALLAVVGLALPASLHAEWMQAVRLGGG
jgi:hydrogenase-4 component F